MKTFLSFEKKRSIFNKDTARLTLIISLFFSFNPILSAQTPTLLRLGEAEIPETVIRLQWNLYAEQSVVPKKPYRVYRDGVKVGDVLGVRYTDIHLIPGATYTYSITSVNSAGVESAHSDPLSITTANARNGVNTPVIQAITGSFVDGQSITITGSSFGNIGPNIILFDDYESGSPSVGNWDSGNREDYIDLTDGYSGNKSKIIYGGGARKSQKRVFTPTGEFFMSYAVRVPDGTFFPGRITGGAYLTQPKTFSDDSSWKFAWLSTDGVTGGAEAADLVVPTHIGGKGNFYFAGNGLSNNQLPVDNRKYQWWDWDNWMNFSVWLRADRNNPASANGLKWFQTVSKGAGYFEKSKTDAPIFKDVNHTTFNQVGFPGWLRTGSGPNVRPLYDDAYIATGEGAAARVELGDAPTYFASKSLAILPATQWSDGSVTATVRKGPFTSGQAVYVYVIDKDNNVNTNGFPLQSVLDTDDLIANSALLLYPNPTSGNITLEIPEVEKGWAYRIISITGQVLKLGTVTTPTSNLNLKGLSNGVYFLHLTSEQQTETIGVIKQ